MKKLLFILILIAGQVFGQTKIDTLIDKNDDTVYYFYDEAWIDYYASHWLNVEITGWDFIEYTDKCYNDSVPIDTIYYLQIANLSMINDTIWYWRLNGRKSYENLLEKSIKENSGHKFRIEIIYEAIEEPTFKGFVEHLKMKYKK